MSKIIKLHPDKATMAEFLEEVEAESVTFQATRAMVVFFNDKNESASLWHELTTADGALIAADCIGMVVAARGGSGFDADD